MTNKDQDANIYLSYNKYDNNINEYHWKNIGAFNEYIDLSITDPFFVQKSLNELDRDYYLAIQDKDDTFDNLYISSQNIKIITLDENHQRDVYVNLRMIIVIKKIMMLKMKTIINFYIWHYMKKIRNLFIIVS